MQEYWVFWDNSEVRRDFRRLWPTEARPKTLPSVATNPTLARVSYSFAASFGFRLTPCLASNPFESLLPGPA